MPFFLIVGLSSLTCGKHINSSSAISYHSTAIPIKYQLFKILNIVLPKKNNLNLFVKFKVILSSNGGAINVQI